LSDPAACRTLETLMALLFIDSFDHYTDASDKYLAGGTNGRVTGRHGYGWNGSLRCSPRPSHPRCIVGFACRLDSTFNTLVELFGGLDGNTIFGFSTLNDGAFVLALFGGASVYSLPDTVRVGQWFYIELDVTVVPTVTNTNPPSVKYALSACTVLIDGTPVISTPPPGTTIVMNGTPSSAGWSYMDIWDNAYGALDDLYICDGAGPPPHNAPLGDIQIDVIRPNGVGALTEWVVNGVAQNWDATNDLEPDDNTSTVVAATAGLSDLYQMEDVNTGNGILGAQILINARRTEEGFATLTPLLRHAGTTTALATRQVSPSYFYRNRDCFVTMPNGDPLTDANMNALQAGFRRDL
jgi:hypothetical protein